MKEHQDSQSPATEEKKGQYSRVSRLEKGQHKVHPAKEARERLRKMQEEPASVAETETPKEEAAEPKKRDRKPLIERKAKSEDKAKAEPKKASTKPAKGNRLMTSAKVRVLRQHKVLLALFSLVLAFLSVSMPYMTGVANGFQSESLYAGYMFTRGTLPYTDIFSTGGFLYYLIIALSYLLGSTFWLVIVHFLAFYFSGIYLYKIVTHMTGRRDAAVSLSVIFYLLNLGLGFGGLYPIQWAMPFVLLGAWFLTKYFAGLTKDEAFILYGFVSVFAFMLEPRTAIFWVISFLAVLVYNLANRHFARGFYQLLAIIFGAMLVFYTAGYFVINLQILGSYVYQAGTYLLTNFALADGNVFLTLVYQLLLALVTGLLTGFLALSKRNSYAKHDRVMKVVLMLTLLVSLVPVLLSQTFQIYDLLLLLPYGLVLTAVVVTPSEEVNEETMTGHESAYTTYLAKHFYLPYLVLAAGVLYPLVTSVMQVGTSQERSTLATYITANSAESDRIYVWDTTANIYLNTQRRSASQIVLPTVNASSSANQQTLSDELLQNSAKFIVVNNSQTLSDTVSANLTSNYDMVTVDNVSQFTLYQKKNT